MAEIRNFVLREKNGKEDGVFTGHQPRQAALKAANRSKGTKSKPIGLRFRERGTKKAHIFKGWTEIVAAPKKNQNGCMQELPLPLNSQPKNLHPFHIIFEIYDGLKNRNIIRLSHLSFPVV